MNAARSGHCNYFETPMPEIRLSEQESRLSARWQAIGGIDAAQIERARNRGATRTASKRELLAALQDAAGKRSLNSESEPKSCNSLKIA